MRQQEKRNVVLIHGIASRGSWFDQANDVLFNDFRCRFFRYSGYHQWIPLPFIAVFLRLRILLLLPVWIVALIIAVQAGWLLPWGAWILGPVGGLIILLGAAKSAARKHRNKIHELVEFIRTVHEEKRYFPPYIIAHSFGTYLTCRGMRELEERREIRFGRIILWGCVVHEGYQWSQRYRNELFEEVRNEVGRADCVVKLASWARKIGILRWVMPDVGGAGVNGFEDSTGLVNNYPAEFRHSTIFEKKYLGYAKHHWLRYFWNIDPDEHDRFCKEIEKLVNVDFTDRDEALQACRPLLQRTYHFAEVNESPVTLGVFLRHRVLRECARTGRRIAVPDIEMDRYVVRICRSLVARCKQTDIRAQHPERLISSAIVEEVSQYRP